MNRKAPVQVKRMAMRSEPGSSSDEDGMSCKLQPKVKRMTMHASSSLEDDETERQTRFRRFSLKLNADVDCARDTPPQLDSSDLGSPKKIWSLLCRKDELYRRECDLLSKHPAMKPVMRSMLFEWIMEVCEDRRLHRETFHLAVDYTDRFLQNTRNINSAKLQLIGSTALAIASKMEEIYPPEIKEFAEFTAGGCKTEEILELETTMLQKLDWSCAPVTSVHWLALYLQLMGQNEIRPEKHVLLNMSNTTQSTPKTHLFSNFSSASSSGTGNDHDYFDSRATTTADNSFIGNTSYSDGHIYVDQRCTVPKLMRDEFVRLAKILDLCVLDIESLRFTYSELAAAVVLSSFEPKLLIEQVTGYRSNQLADACDFVEPFVKICEQIEPPGCPIPQFDGIPSDDLHNIQTAFYGALNELTKVIEIRKEKLARRKATQESIMFFRRKRLLN